MGKVFSGIAAAILMAAGLTAATIGGAQADPYPGVVRTNCDADNLNNPRVGNPAKVKFRVRTAGNGRPRGAVTFRYERRASGFIVRQYTRRYRGPGWQRHSFSGIPRGKYVVSVVFDSRPGSSVYKNCRTEFRQRVRPRR